jgi:CO/xanthine dehydrogenase Mo-binding subunit
MGWRFQRRKRLLPGVTLGELPTVVSAAAIVTALRNATGRELPRVPARPDDVVGLSR